MMNIVYKDIKDIEEKDLSGLFSCVDWTILKDLTWVRRAFINSSDIFSAWDDDKLVGIVQVIADGGLTVHVHFLVVLPEYRNNGIGTKLMNMVAEKYKDYVRLYIEARPEKVEYYKREFEFKNVNSLVLMKKDLDGRKVINKRLGIKKK